LGPGLMNAGDQCQRDKNGMEFVFHVNLILSEAKSDLELHRLLSAASKALRDLG
jgi:hypothetical protein